MTGPKASAGALALLPVLGIALGEAIGAGPLGVLTGTGLGQALLLAGVTLLCAGVLWSGRITSQVALR
jgi:tight adherence protein B